MKGVSSVIAIILILMIVVALAALAYTWFTGIFASLTATTSTAVTTTTSGMQSSFTLETAKCFATDSKILSSIRNVGSTNMDLTKLSVYVNDALRTGTQGLTGTLKTGERAYFNSTSASACTTAGDCGKTLMVTSETGLQQSTLITC